VALDQVRQLKPDVVVINITMPVMNGLKATVEIRRFAPSTKSSFSLVSDQLCLRSGLSVAHGQTGRDHKGKSNDTTTNSRDN
jgi:DNA-binding NarL/FixJ family response regulator